MYLEFLVIILPTLFGLSIELVSKSIRERWYYRLGVVLFGLSLSGLTWLQISRSHKAAAKEQQTAIEETSKRVSASVSESVSKNVSKSVSEQYAQTINTLQLKIGSLEGQLSEQGKSVDIIKRSNIVTDKNPIKVEITNQNALPAGQAPLDIHASQLAGNPIPEYGKNARQIILTTNRVMDGARVRITCKNRINQCNATLPDAGAILGGGRAIDEHTCLSSIDSPNWSPDRPLVVTLFFDEDDVGECTIFLR